MSNELHFEFLWEKSESTFKEDESSITAVIMELRAKISLYEAIENNGNIPPQDKIKLKHVSFGEILKTLTHLSQMDNINVFEALTLVLKNFQQSI